MQRIFRSYSYVSVPILWLISLGLLVSGCARDHYHLAADQNTYGVLQEKTVQRPWYLPANYTLDVDPSSRLFDPTDPNDPMLPHPGPHLYSYPLPQSSNSSSEQFEPLPPPLDEAPSEALPEPGQGTDSTQGVVRLASNSYRPNEIRFAPVDDDDMKIVGDSPAELKPYAAPDEGLTIQPIPAAYWDALPRVCLRRMLEFESVREEYRRTFETEPPDALRDQSRKLTFEDIVELAYLNSREYQAQKEILYSTAMALTLERYDYMTKFSTFGNGTAANYDHTRTNGVAVDNLAVPSSLRSDRMVALGGTFVTQFANDVVLTFNGPQGFGRQISSNLLFDFTQSVFQRDVLLEPLIQSERNVVYAARDFTRFRRQFFFDLAQTYYEGQLALYRGVEIETQNYFAFVRALDQAEAEVRSGVGNAPPRFQIDQIEQDMLQGRSQLITRCNSLESSLDRLKLTLGLPTETPINIDLRELETLTQRDEIAVAGELIRRARERIDVQLASELPDREEILSAAVVLSERVLNWMQLRQQIGQEGANDEELRKLRARLRMEEAYQATDRARLQLAEDKKPPVVPISVFRGTMDLAQARLEVVARQLQLSDELAETTNEREAVLKKFVDLKKRTEAILARVAKVLRGGTTEDLAALQLEAEAILLELEGLDAPARRMVRAPVTRPDAQTELRQAVRDANQLRATTDRLTSESRAGLTSVNLSVDDAMVTALVQRFDLMNERGFLADDWRDIKLAADELKSVLNLNVSQSLRTSNSNQPAPSSLDVSQTSLSATLDLPLNRRQQRNGFRQSLINYQAGRRSLMALEDGVKFAAREDLRNLDLDRVQYDIAVVSAALASERVYSTQLELSLGLATVTARDFLESQRAYRASISAVANGRLGYIVDRAQLAFDLELLLLDDDGFWPDLNNEDYQPSADPIFPFDADRTYGDLPHAVWPSKMIKRMLNVPPPGYQVIGAEPVDGEGIHDADGSNRDPLDPPAPRPAGQ